MCDAPPDFKVAAMDRTTMTIRLELHLGDGSLTGRAEDGDGAVREFSGWLGLIAAIDDLVAEAAADLPHHPTDRNGSSPW
jgi:hypothetical protein